jgi:ketol-acid reductoisomerase
MQQILADIQSGAFAREWIEESRQGGANFERMRREQNDHLIERVGAELRKMMPWSEEGRGSGLGRAATAAEGGVPAGRSRAPESLRA